MSEKHVVFGTGQVGHALVGQLAGSGYDVRAVSLHRPSGLPEGVDWRGADVTDPEAAADAAKGASVDLSMPQRSIHQVARTVPAVAEGGAGRRRAHRALLVTLENVYGYGSGRGRADDGGPPARRDDRQGPDPGGDDAGTVGRGDAGRVRIAIGRASDLFGAGATESALGSRVFANALAGNASTSSATPISSTPTATFPTSRRARHPRHR